MERPGVAGKLMNLPRLRELYAAWCDGSIRAAELAELRDMLPEVIEAAERAPIVDPDACPDCHGDGGELIDQCRCGAWAECSSCHGEG